MDLLIIGATGLVGREMVRQADARPDVSRIVALVRRDPGARPSPKVLYRVVDFAALDEGLDDAFAADAVLCAMGTTARQTPDPVAYRQIEVEIPLAVARRAQAAGATRFGLVSAVGASRTSRSTYLRQKADLEHELEQMGWDRLVIARPSVLRGERDEFRPSERLGLLVGGLLPSAYKPVDAAQVAAGVLRAVMLGGGGVAMLDNAHLRSVSA